MHLEFVVDGYGHVWLVGCRNITFYNDQQALDPSIDKDSLKFPKSVFIKHEHCGGAYCDVGKESAFHEDGDEAAELFVSYCIRVLTWSRIINQSWGLRFR